MRYHSYKHKIGGYFRGRRYGRYYTRTGCLVYLLIMAFIFLSTTLVACTLPSSKIGTQAPTRTSVPQSTPDVLQEITETPLSTATETPSPSPTLTPTPMPTPSPTPGVTEKATGIIDKIYQKSGVYYIQINYVEFLSGDAAIKQALADKSDLLIDNGDGTYSLPDDYYISDKSKKIRTFPIDANCELKVVNWSGDNIGLKKVKISKFIAAFKDEGGNMLVDISVKNGVAVALDEIYTP